MTEEFDLKERDPKEVYRNVVMLYGILLERRENLSIRRATLNLKGQVKAEPIDFICDIELKARRILAPKEFEVFRKLVKNGKPELLPMIDQIDLGKLWNSNDLNFDGPYGGLYFAAKNEH